MLRSVFFFLLIIVFFVDDVALNSSQPPPQNPHVVVETSLGEITLELFRSQARVTVVNFLTYVQAGYYDGTIFHRVIRSAMIQGGGLNPDLSPRTEGLRGGILNEAINGLQNERGTVAMARLGTPTQRARNSSLTRRTTTLLITKTHQLMVSDMPSSVRSLMEWTWSTESPASQHDD